MCGRFALNSTSEALAADFDLGEVPVFASRFNIAPTQDIAVVREDEVGAREYALLHWGLVASWTKDPKESRSPINARSETAAQKPTFRRALAERRCLVPASGFYEWQAGKGGPKRPFLIQMRARELLGMAGLHELWRGDGGNIIESVAILTTEANATLRPIHARMPVILGRADYARWLDREVKDVSAVADLMVPCPDDWLEAIAVSTKVNNPRFDEPACIEPV
ncbi:MAG: SOS response-associated peptidase [bacterium]|nr:SOS response-associated peptidase [bacterium]